MTGKNLKDVLAAGDNKIGFLTWYDTRNAHATRSKLKALFQKHNLDERHLPDDIKEKHAFQKAVRLAMVETSKSSDDRRSIAKLIVDGSEKLIYGVVDLNVSERNESISPDFSDKVWFDKTNLSVHFDKGHDLSKRVKDNYDQLCGEYTTRDISRMVVKTMDRLCSVSLRDAGVIYFVPAAFEHELQALQSVVNDLGESNMRVYTLGSHEGNASGVEQAARSQIQDRISSLKQEIADLLTNIEEGSVKGQTIANSVEVRRRKFNELKLRCKVLADALRIKAESLEGDLDKVDKLIEQDLESLIAGPSNSKVAVS